MQFAELCAAGIDVTPGLSAIYERAAEAWGDRPIDFDLNFEHTSADGGMRIYRERVQIWLKRTAADPIATLIHELAHAVIARELHPPRLTPEAPTGAARMILSDLISIPEHLRVHEVMAEYGVAIDVEAQSQSQNFLRDVPGARIGPNGHNVHLSVGYAMMLTAFRYAPLVPQIVRAMQRKGGHVARLGEALAEYVGRPRTVSLYEDARALMTLAEITPEFQRCVLSEEEFARRYGFA